MAQWLRIHLPIQGTRVRARVWEDPTCCRATKPVHHNYWACALEPTSHNYWACKPQLLKPACLEPVLRHKGSHCNEKPAHRNEEQAPLATTREKPVRSNEDPTQPKINKFINETTTATKNKHKDVISERKWSLRSFPVLRVCENKSQICLPEGEGLEIFMG